MPDTHSGVVPLHNKRRSRKSCPSCGALNGNHFKGCEPFAVTWWQPPELPWIGATLNDRLPDSVYLIDFELPAEPSGHPVIEFIIADIEESGLSPSYVAERAGLNTETIKLWCRRHTSRPHDKTFRKVLQVLGWNSLPELQHY